MRNSFRYCLEGHSEISNNEALLNRFYHNVKMKAYIGGGGGGQRGRLSPSTQILTIFIGIEKANLMQCNKN